MENLDNTLLTDTYTDSQSVTSYVDIRKHGETEGKRLGELRSSPADQLFQKFVVRVFGGSSRHLIKTSFEKRIIFIKNGSNLKNEKGNRKAGKKG